MRLFSGTFFDYILFGLFEPTGIPVCSKTKRKMSIQSYSVQFDEKQESTSASTHRNRFLNLFELCQMWVVILQSKYGSTYKKSEIYFSMLVLESEIHFTVRTENLSTFDKIFDSKFP